MIHVGENELLLANRVGNTSAGELLRVDIETGLQTLLFENPLPTLPFGMDWLVEDELLLFSGQTDVNTAGFLYRYDFATEAPEIFIDGSGDVRANALHLPRGIVIDHEKMIAFVTIAHEDARLNKGSVYVLDLESKERMVLSRNYFEL